MHVQSQFRHVDTKRPDGTYIWFERFILDDETCTPSELLYDDGVSEERLEAWRKGEWRFVGVVAVANITVVRNGHGTMYRLESAGIWGIESDSSDEFFDDTYREQRDELLADMDMFPRFTVEGF